MNVHRLASSLATLAFVVSASACSRQEEPPSSTRANKAPEAPPVSDPAPAPAPAPAPDPSPSPSAGSGSDQGVVPPLPSLTGWTLDPENSSVTFACKHANHTTVRGMFQQPAGTIVLDTATPARSKVTATIDVKKLSTGVDERDNHLKGPDFFDSAQFPTVTFTSTGVTTSGPASYSVTGDLTMHGVTKPVTLAVTMSPPFQHFGSIRRGIEATTSISRQAFGVGVAAWNVPAESGGLLIADTVALTIDAELVLDQPDPAKKR